MIRLQAFCRYLDELLLSAPMPDYCPNGLQVEGKGEIKKLATAVSANLKTIQAAADKKVDALFVHHGIFWDKEKPLLVGTHKEKVKLLLEHGISLIAYHLPLDAHVLFGNNWKAAKEMGWTQLEPFGIGVRGVVEPVTSEEFQRKLERYYQHKAHAALGGKKTVRSAALISGGAYRSISDAVKEGVDCFITGNFDEPAWNIAFEERINFFAMGHTATERVGPRAIGEHLAGHFKLEHEFLDVENPF